MASSTPYASPHFPYSDPNSPLRPAPTRHRNSCALFLCKSLFFCLFLLLLPLFPSEAPEFVNQTLLNKFWELFHLLFVGIAVSYGLFSRRPVQVSVDETRSSFESQQSYLSKLFHVTSIFEDVEDLTASDEKKLNEVWYIQPQPHRESVSGFGDLNAQSYEQGRPRYSMPQKRYENSYEFANADNVGLACKSRYTRGGSVVVVAKTNLNSGELVEPGAIVNYRPLGLPVRSLRSSLSEAEDVEFDRGGESSGSGSKSSSMSSEKFGRSEFGDNCCKNLEEKFDEAVIASLSPFQWREKSGKKVMRQRGVGNAIRPSHFRPPSIDETQFESLRKSRSLHSSLSHSSQTCSISSSSMRKHSKMSSLSNISSKSLHSRQYSMSSLTEDSRGCSEDHLLESENPSEYHESVTSSPHSDMNFSSIPKAASRGKSVRTVRTNAVPTEEMKAEEMYRNQVENDHNPGKKFEEARSSLSSSYMREDGMGYGWPSVVNPNAITSNRLPKTTFLEIRKQKEEDMEILMADEAKEDNSEDNSEREDESLYGSSDEEAASSVAESGAHEVDKKAGEFIAKFREQIKLQRMGSVERLRGWGSFSSTTSSHFS